MPTANVDGVNLHYEIEGEGPPLLLIAGLGANSSSWTTIKPLLKGRFTCISFDNRGVGRSDTPPEGFAAQANGLRRYDSRPMLPAVKAPTLVLVGAEDVLTPVSQSIEMAELIPNARLQVLPRGGHGMAIEYTAETVSAITAFLAAAAQSE